MKKFTAMIMLVMVILATGVIAHGEVIGEMHFSTAPYSETVDYETDKDGTRHYYVTMTADGRDYSVKREVSRTIYYELLAEEKADQERHDNLWYVKAWSWTTEAARKVGDFVVFWK